MLTLWSKCVWCGVVYVITCSQLSTVSSVVKSCLAIVVQSFPGMIWDLSLQQLPGFYIPCGQSRTIEQACLSEMSGQVTAKACAWDAWVRFWLMAGVGRADSGHCAWLMYVLCTIGVVNSDVCFMYHCGRWLWSSFNISWISFTDVKICSVWIV